MKTTVVLSILLIVFTLALNAQETQEIQDPYRLFKGKITLDMGAGIASVIGSPFSARDYLTFNAALFYKKPSKFNSPTSLFLGLLMHTERYYYYCYHYYDGFDAYLVNAVYLDIPLLWSLRVPLHRAHGKHFKAININFGPYIGVPLFSNEYDIYKKKYTQRKVKDNKYGLLLEYTMTILNKKGYGHRLGLRFFFDETKLIGVSNSIIEYNSITFFYTIGSIVFHKKSK